MVMITIVIGTNDERGSALLVAYRGRVAARDGAADGAVDGRREPPSLISLGRVGGLLSNRGQLRLAIALGKTPVHLSKPYCEVA